MSSFRRFALPLLLLMILLGTAGCTRNAHEQLRISANPWIGFTPLVYAQQKGWLKETGIKFLWVVGLEENVKLYRQGLSDGFVATQYEYFSLKEEQDVKPYFLFDRSAGADVILSNKSLEALRRSDHVTAYLEITGLNKDLLQAFIDQYGINCDSTMMHSSDPESMSLMKPGDDPSVLIAYEPYATVIEKNGFHRVASTREITKMMVIDALWLNADIAAHHAGDIRMLKAAVDRAVNALHKDPKEYYDTVAAYLKDQSYDEFSESLKGIEWINHSPSEAIMNYLQSQHIATDALLP